MNAARRRVPRPRVRHRQRPARAVQLARAALVVLGADEVGQHVVPAPVVEAQRLPAVVVGAVAADVDHRVDRGGATESAPAREHALAATEPRLGIRDERPVVLAGARGETAGGNVQLVRGVRRAGLEQADRDIGVLREARGEDAPRRAGTDDHVIELAHRCRPPESLRGSTFSARARGPVKARPSPHGRRRSVRGCAAAPARRGARAEARPHRTRRAPPDTRGPPRAGSRRATPPRGRRGRE